MSNHPENEHLHDISMCETCAKLRKVWKASGFYEAIELLRKNFGQTATEVNELWGSIPVSARAPEFEEQLREFDKGENHSHDDCPDCKK